MTTKRADVESQLQSIRKWRESDRERQEYEPILVSWLEMAELLTESAQTLEAFMPPEEAFVLRREIKKVNELIQDREASISRFEEAVARKWLPLLSASAEYERQVSERLGKGFGVGKRLRECIAATRMEKK